MKMANLEEKKDGNQSESKVDRNVKRRVDRNNFKLVDLVGLGLNAVISLAKYSLNFTLYSNI